MKTFRYDDHIIEYEDDTIFNGNEYIRTIENTKCCEIQANSNIRISEECTKRSDNMVSMCNSKLGIGIGEILAALAIGGIAIYKAASMSPPPTNPPTPETPQSKPEENKQ